MLLFCVLFLKNNITLVLTLNVLFRYVIMILSTIHCCSNRQKTCIVQKFNAHYILSWYVVIASFFKTFISTLTYQKHTYRFCTIKTYINKFLIILYNNKFYFKYFLKEKWFLFSVRWTLHLFYTPNYTRTIIFNQK